MSDAGGMNAYEVRVHFKTGLGMNFGFKDVGRAKAFAEMCAEAKMQGAAQKPASQTQCHGFDECGREAFMDGSQMLMVQLIDIQAEIVGMLRMRAVVQDWTVLVSQRLGLDQPEQPREGPQSNGSASRRPIESSEPEPEYAPVGAIGRFAT